METEFIAAIARANIAAALAVVVVLLLRGRVRQLFGSQKAYALWTLAPIAALATLLPARHVIDVVTNMPVRVAPVTDILVTKVARMTDFHAPQTSVFHAPLMAIPLQTHQMSLPQVTLLVWLLGVLASVCLLAWRQYRFVRSLGLLERRDVNGFRIFQACSAGAVPALVGAVRPRVIVPSDFDERFDAEERQLILAHERVHLRRGDAQINALLALSTCLCWFNPLAHVAALAVRRDQELACDAAVLATRPEAKRSYAAALLKTQLSEVVIAFGCAWPAQGRNSLHERIGLLGAQRPAFGRRMIGALGVAIISIGGGATVWAAQPAIHTSQVRIQMRSVDAAPVQQTVPLRIALTSAPQLAVQTSAYAEKATIQRTIADRQFGPPRSFADTQVELFGIAARLHVVPEDRADISVEIAPGVNLPSPSTRIERGNIVIDGGLGMAANNCRVRFSGDGVADVPGVGYVPVNSLPVVVVHTPRRLNLLVRGVVVSDIGASEGGNIHIDSCGDATLSDVADSLNLSLTGFGNVYVGTVRGPLDAELFGVGRMTIARALQAATLKLVGSGNLSVGQVSGSLDADMTGSGALNVDNVSGALGVHGIGSGPIRIGAVQGAQVEVRLHGSSSLNVDSGETQRLTADLSGSSRMTFGGRARLVRATIDAGAGDLTIAEADRVEKTLAPYAHGDVIIQHKN